jgi:hypothetical protein
LDTGAKIGLFKGLHQVLKKLVLLGNVKRFARYKRQVRPDLNLEEAVERDPRK